MRLGVLFVAFGGSFNSKDVQSTYQTVFVEERTGRDHQQTHDVDSTSQLTHTRRKIDRRTKDELRKERWQERGEIVDLEKSCSTVIRARLRPLL